MKNKISVFFAGMTLIVLMSPIAHALEGFSDLNATHPNYAAIMDLKTRGVINGYPDGSFKPDQAVNRVEALKIIFNTVGLEVNNSAKKAVFSDISQSEWYAPYLNRAFEMNIVQGYPDNSFKPTQTVNLVENLKMLLNTYKIDVTGVSPSSYVFADVAGDQWYSKYVQYAKDKKMIVADAANKVYPAQGMTRANLAETAYRLIQIREKGLEYFGQVKDATPPTVDDQLPNTVWDNTLNITINNLAFSKTDILVPQGAKIKWINNDSVDHQVVSKVSGQFSSPVLKPGDSYTFTFNDLGVFEYSCSIHPSMTGKLTVKLPHQVPTI